MAMVLCGEGLSVVLFLAFLCNAALVLKPVGNALIAPKKEHRHHVSIRQLL